MLDLASLDELFGPSACVAGEALIPLQVGPAATECSFACCKDGCERTFPKGGETGGI